MRISLRNIRSFYPLLLGAVALLLALYAIGGGQIPTKSAAEPVGVEDSSALWKKAYWESRIEAVGGAAAYQELGDSIRVLPSERQHTAAHIFAAALYKKEGYTAIALCGEMYAWGCFHEMMAKTLAEQGFEVVKDLTEKCHKLPTPQKSDACEHSLGHGFLVWFGYGEKNLTEALEACRAYVPQAKFNPLSGCYSGVYMEYFFRTMAGQEDLGARILPPQEYQALCARLDEEFRPSCAAQAMQSWILSIPWSESDSYPRYGALCGAFTEKTLAQHCYSSIGDHLPVSDSLPPEEIAARCQTVSQEESAQVLCTAASAAITRLLNPPAAEHVCVHLVGPAREYCLSFARGEVDQGRLVELLPRGL